MKNSGSYPKKASNLKYHPYWRFLISQYQAAVLLIDFFFFKLRQSDINSTNNSNTKIQLSEKK